MVDYKKLYALLAGTMDDAITMLESIDWFQHNKARDILQAALLEAEDAIISDKDYGADEKK